MEKDIFEQNLKCPICLTVATDPYGNNCCGHLFCKRCIDHITDSKCPLCRKQVKFRENTFIKRFMENYLIVCEFGCEEMLPISDMKFHRFSCESAKFKCSINDCKIELKRNDMLTHMIQVHADLSVILAEKYSGLKVVFDKHSLIDQIKEQQLK